MGEDMRIVNKFIEKMRWGVFSAINRIVFRLQGFEVGAGFRSNGRICVKNLGGGDNDR